MPNYDPSTGYPIPDENAPKRPGQYDDPWVPWLNVARATQSDWEAAGMPRSELGGANDWQRTMRAGATAAPRTSPYNPAVAGQSRAAQMALFNQMQARAAGPSLAAMQGRGAVGSNLQAALASRAPNSVAGRMGAGNAAGLGGAVGSGALAEQMQAAQQQGGLAGGLRGRDIQGASAAGSAAVQTRSLEDAARRYYAGAGAALQNSMDQREINRYKLAERLRLQNTKNARQTSNDVMSTAATVLSTLFPQAAGAINGVRDVAVGSNDPNRRP